MAIQSLSASVSGAASVSAVMRPRWGLRCALAGAGSASGVLTLKKIGLKSSVQGEAFARGSLCSRFSFGAAQSNALSEMEGELGVQRSRSLGSNPCEFIMIEGDGSSRGAELLKFNARWQRRIADDADTMEWTEGKNIIMSSSPTMIVNTGAPITSAGTTSKLWIDACSYHPSVVWPSSGVKNQSIEAKFSSSLRGFALESSVENALPTPSSYSWNIPSRIYTARFEGKNRFDIRLADTSNRRGLCLGYAYDLKSDLVNTSQSGSWASGFHFTIPDELTWHLVLDYYIKTCCDFSDPAQERNVAYIHHEVDLTTKITNKNADPIERTASDVIGTLKYMDMDQNRMDEAMERHAVELWKQLDNFIHPEEQWQMYPIRLDNISMKVTKKNSRIEFQLANQYPLLTYTDSFVDRVLNLFLDSESPVPITQTSSATAI